MKETRTPDRGASSAAGEKSKHTTHGRSEPMPVRSKQAARAALLGFAVDYYDIYLPVVALALAIHYFQPESIYDPLQ